MLIAYANGLFLLWDISRGQVLFVGGGKDLQLNDELDEPSSRVDVNVPFDALENSLSEKEISALCWASSNGSILAVGYVDGDILFWKTSITASGRDQQGSPSSKNIVRLQLSSSEKRLPVIVLHWSGNSRAPNNCDGQLFIYGGDEIGSEEVLTVCCFILTHSHFFVISMAPLYTWIRLINKRISDDLRISSSN